jgi:hypothetical protein
LPLLAELVAASLALPTILAYSGNDMARIGKRMKLVRGILEASDATLSCGHCANRTAATDQSSP